MPRPWRSRLLLWQLLLRLCHDVVTASLCLGGSDIFVSIRENSPMGQYITNLSVSGDPRPTEFRLCLTGEDSDWFYLENQTIRLNSPNSRVLDREVQGPVLLAQLTCYDEDVVQSQHRILVEVLNENDNKPNFLEETIQPFTISELAAVNSVVFTVKAFDADGDMITYIIDQSSPDASFFRIDLPNSGHVVLDKPLDYETKTSLQLLMWARETNSVEKFNTTAIVTVNIEDGDDQYPHFLPCTPVSPGGPACTNPTYTANVTETDKNLRLQFSPGPIRAVDGDRGLNTPLIYSILSGEDQGRFVIDSQTGDIRLTRAVFDRRQTPSFKLSVMASQLDDPLKYTVAPVLVRVLYENLHPPFFNRTIYKGFVVQSSSPASIVSTYGNQVLLVQVTDWDFIDGVNPNIRYFLHPPSVSDGLYDITQGGVLISRTDRLHAFDRHILQVVARDEESGEEITTSVDIEVLQRGQAVPNDAFSEGQQLEQAESGLVGGLAAIIMLVFLLSLLLLLLRIIRRHRHHEPVEQEDVTHPSVVSPGRPLYPTEDVSYSRGLGQEFEPSSAGFIGRQGLYTRKQSLRPPSISLSSSTIILDPGRFPVSETPEFIVTVKDETRRLSVVKEEPGSLSAEREGLQTIEAVSNSDDITAVILETLHDDDVKKNPIDAASQDAENLYRTISLSESPA